jgi:glucose/arabinose dehydrogenase
MDNDDHTTRTLLLSKKVPGTLLVSRGSTSNIDLQAKDITTGHSQIRTFNINPSSSDVKAYDYANGGTLLGWGLRNSVGVAEEPTTGGIWSVENSVDDIEREGVDIHENNPGEELNFHGYLNGTKSSVEQGANYGYPLCYAVWNVTEIPKNEALQVGTQFLMGNENGTNNDTTCAKTTVPPRLTFPSHWAPLDIKFNTKGSVAYITSHGSW